MKQFLRLTTVAAGMAAVALAHPHDGVSDHDHSNGGVHENGIGPDPDGDTNPATDTTVVPFVGEILVGADGTTFPVLHFEPPPGTHGEPIVEDYHKDFGVKFGPGLSWQICEGQRHFQYNSMCTYEAPTSGDFAAGYVNRLNRPLVIEFDEPICFVSMSIYPTGAKKDEPFLFSIEGRDSADQVIDSASLEFEWNKDTVRFNNIAGAYFTQQSPNKIAISMRSLDPGEAKTTLRYLIDDLSFLGGSCDAAVSEVEERTGLELRSPVYRLNREED